MIIFKTVKALLKRSVTGTVEAILDILAEKVLVKEMFNGIAEKIIIKMLRSLAKKTSNTLDDDAVEIIVELIERP